MIGPRGTTIGVIMSLLGIVAIGGIWVFSQLYVKDSAGDHKITISSSTDEAADRTITIPALGEAVTMVVTGDTLTQHKVLKVEADGKIIDSNITDNAGVVTINTAKSTVDVDIDYLAAQAALSAQ
jgi:hypothetical protein